MLQRCGENRTLLQCWWKCKLIQPLWKAVWRFLKKLKIELPYDPAIPLLGIYPEKTIIQKESCSTMFTAARFVIARTWKQPKCPSTDEWIKRCCTSSIYNGILLSYKKKWNWVICNEVDGPGFCHTEWTKPEREKQILYANTCIWNLKEEEKKRLWRT